MNIISDQLKIVQSAPESIVSCALYPQNVEHRFRLVT